VADAPQIWQGLVANTIYDSRRTKTAVTVDSFGIWTFRPSGRSEGLVFTPELSLDSGREGQAFLLGTGTTPFA